MDFIFGIDWVDLVLVDSSGGSDAMQVGRRRWTRLKHAKIKNWGRDCDWIILTVQ